MKIEKINNNQIKCFLNKGDLISREIKVSELAYGTEKAQQLFKDMMKQASVELGFEVENVPLMIEAVPLSTDSIMLIITKVNNPDELEDKFLNIPTSETRKFKKKSLIENSDNNNLISNNPTLNKNINAFFIYVFNNFDDLFKVAEKLISYPIDNSTLYKNTENNKYYLTIISSQINRIDAKYIKGILSEYGEQLVNDRGILNYYDEHYETIIKDKALKVLISI